MMGWLEFKTPERLWVLLALPVLIIAYLVLMRLKGRTSLRFTNTGVLGRVIGSQRRWTRHIAVAMSLCSLVALGLAWAQPLGTEKVPRERATVVPMLSPTGWRRRKRRHCSSWMRYLTPTTSHWYP